MVSETQCKVTPISRTVKVWTKGVYQLTPNIRENHGWAGEGHARGFLSLSRNGELIFGTKTSDSPSQD